MKKRKESRALIGVTHNQETNSMTITREVSKTVKGADGKDFKRKATINFEVPEKLDDLAALVGSFGSVEKLAQAAFYGVREKARLDATNELMKGDKASKALKKMASALKAVMPTLTDELAVQMVLSNPEVAKAFQSGPVSAEITMNVNPASADFTFPALTDAEPEADEAEAETEPTATV